MRYAVIALSVMALGAGIISMRMHDDRTACSESQPSVIAFGDSLVTGYGASAGADAVSGLSLLSGIPIRNRGVSGDTSGRALGRIDSVIKERPDIVIVLVGGNDALSRVPVAETEANIGQIVARLQDAGATVLLVGVLGGFPTDPYADMFARIRRERGVRLVPNILSGIIGRDGYMSDAIHPNDAGYRKMAERLHPVLEDICGSS